MFQDGSVWNHFVNILSADVEPLSSLSTDQWASMLSIDRHSSGDWLPNMRCRPQSSPSMTWGYNTPKRLTCPRLCTRTKLMLTRRQAYVQPSADQIGWYTWCKTGFNRFPLNNFKYFLTLFSKFFSSFPHGTCSLSVSRQYLALEGIYLPFWAAIPNNPTRWKRIT